MRESATNNKNTWGIKMSEIDIFGFIGMSVSFATFFMACSPLAVVIIAYLFRNPTVVRAGAMVSALIGVVMLTFSRVRRTASSLHSARSARWQEWLKSRPAFSLRQVCRLRNHQTGWMMALSLVQVIINLVLTVYVFLFAQWDNSQFNFCTVAEGPMAPFFYRRIPHKAAS